MRGKGVLQPHCCTDREAQGRPTTRATGTEAVSVSRRVRRLPPARQPAARLNPRRAHLPAARAQVQREAHDLGLLA